jgi:TM2 domain-containing membrane protein YozV
MRLALCLSLAALPATAQAQELRPLPRPKSATAAWGLSFVYPGLGQAYNGDWGRAAAFGVPASIGWGLYWNSWEGCVENRTNCATRNVSAAIIMAAWIGSQIDAPRRARAINRERGLAPTRRSPTKAWALSFLYPGLGQAYNGDWGRAAAFAVPANVGLGLYWSGWEDCTVNHTNCATRNVGAAVIVATWIGSQIDAPRRARAINRERGLSLELGPAPASLGVSLARIRF